MESIEGFPDIDVPWDDLNDAATDLGTKAGIAKSYLTGAPDRMDRGPGCVPPR